MKLPSAEEVERSVGGRPTIDNPKVRVSFYLLPEEAEALRSESDSKGLSLSIYLRLVMKKHLNNLRKS